MREGSDVGEGCGGCGEVFIGSREKKKRTHPLPREEPRKIGPNKPTYYKTDTWQTRRHMVKTRINTSHDRSSQSGRRQSKRWTPKPMKTCFTCRPFHLKKITHTIKTPTAHVSFLQQR